MAPGLYRAVVFAVAGAVQVGTGPEGTPVSSAVQVQSQPNANICGAHKESTTNDMSAVSYCCYFQGVLAVAVLVAFADVALAQGGCTVKIMFNNDARCASSSAYWDLMECPLAVSDGQDSMMPHI